MADRYLLESSATDGYLLEDGSGVLLLEPPLPQTLTPSAITAAFSIPTPVVSVVGPWRKVASFKDDSHYNNTSYGGPISIGISGHQVGDLVVVTWQYGTSGATDITSAACTDDAGTPNPYYPNPTSPTIHDTTSHQGLRKWAGVVVDASVANVSVSWVQGGAAPTAWVTMLVEIWRHDAGALGAGDPHSVAPAGQFQATPGTGTDAITSTAITPAVDGCLIHGSLCYPASNPSSTTLGTGFQLAVDDLTAAQVETEYVVQVTAASIAATWTEGSAQPTLAIVSAFKPPDTSQTLTPSSITSAFSVAAPTLALGALTLATSSLTAAFSTPAPTLLLGSITVTPGIVSAAFSISTPTIVVGGSGTTLTPTALSSAFSISSPALVRGSLTLAPSPISAVFSEPSPTLQLGSRTLTPSSVVAAFVLASVTVSGGGAATGFEPIYRAGLSKRGGR